MATKTTKLKSLAPTEGVPKRPAKSKAKPKLKPLAPVKAEAKSKAKPKVKRKTGPKPKAPKVETKPQPLKGPAGVTGSVGRPFRPEIIENFDTVRAASENSPLYMPIPKGAKVESYQNSMRSGFTKLLTRTGKLAEGQWVKVALTNDNHLAIWVAGK